MKKDRIDTIESCNRSLLPIRDTLDIINGKWKVPILFALMFEDLRFSDFERDIKGISPRMLSKELKELELNKLIRRNLTGKNKDIIVYSITTYGWTLKKIIKEIENWGIRHRETIMNTVYE